MDFADVLKDMKVGNHYERKGWNGRGMFITIQEGYPEGVKCNKNSSEAYGVKLGSIIQVRPYLVIRSVDGMFVPWLPSQTDILATDWQKV